MESKKGENENQAEYHQVEAVAEPASASAATTATATTAIIIIATTPTTSKIIKSSSYCISNMGL